MLQVTKVSGGYSSDSIIKDVSFSVNTGEIFGIVGPNGSGKTTLLSMISGSLSVSQGEILIHERKINSYSSKELARIMAVLPQHSATTFSYTVEEIVMLGRYPYQKGLFGLDHSNMDKTIVYEAMEQTGVYQYRNKTIHELSGGERQRVMLARALAQEPDLLLLDEPTNHLDIAYQMSLLDLLKSWTKEKGLTVVTILHDLNMASLYCDQVLLLNDGQIAALNKPIQVMEEGRLQDVYKAAVKRNEHPSVPSPLITLVPKEEKLTERSLIDDLQVEQYDEYIKIQSPYPLKTFSSAVIGAGFGWEKIFVNRHVDKNYNCDDPYQEFKEYLQNLGVDHEETIGMMTAAILSDATFVKVVEKDFSIIVVVTAGLSNAVDASKAYLQSESLTTVGTINTWVFIDGKLTDAAFVQAMMTATEAKVKALHEENILDPVTQTIATGTSTDSLMVAATQTGTELPYAGTITPLGKNIAKAVFEATVIAARKNKERRGIE